MMNVGNSKVMADIHSGIGTELFLRYVFRSEMAIEIEPPPLSSLPNPNEKLNSL